MELKEIQEKLTPIISKYLPDEVKVEEITPEKDILKDLQINSAYLIDIIIACLLSWGPIFTLITFFAPLGPYYYFNIGFPGLDFWTSMLEHNFLNKSE